MKKLLLLLTLPLLALTFNSCSSDDDGDNPNYEQLIVGTWKMTHANNEVWPYEETTATLKADKTYTSQGYFDNGHGTYTVSGNKLTLYYGGETPYFSAEIVSLNATEGNFKATYDSETLTVRAIKVQ